MTEPDDHVIQLDSRAGWVESRLADLDHETTEHRNRLDHYERGLVELEKRNAALEARIAGL